MSLSVTRSAPLGALLLSSCTGAASAQQLFSTDVVIRNGLCVGADCAITEPIPSGVLRLKGVTTSIEFEDTSGAPGFPTTDWRLIANDGGEDFTLRDDDAGTTPLRVEAGAPSLALHLEADGDLGLGTSQPLAQVHVVDGNAPRVRLEQDGSNGFAPQTWEVVGTDLAFSVQDVTDGLATPFQIHPGAGSHVLVLRDGRAGVGTAAPATALHLVNGEGVGQIRMEDSGGSGPLKMLDLRNDGAVQLWMDNTTKPDASWLFSAGRSMLLAPVDDPRQAVFELRNTGDLILDGALTQSSDKHRKTAIEPVDADAILAAVAAMPVAEWTYIHDAEAGIRHIGPMAQDFHAAFGTGADPTGISALDGTGVALAAIQALAARIETLEARLAAIR